MKTGLTGLFPACRPHSGAYSRTDPHRQCPPCPTSPAIRKGRSRACTATPASAADEFVDEQHPELLEFLGPIDGDENFTRLDAGFVRVIEDLVDVLLAKNMLNITDLPAEAQAKLFARKGFRDRVAANSLQLFDTNSDGDHLNRSRRPPPPARHCIPPSSAGLPTA